MVAACKRHGRLAGTVAAVDTVPQLLDEGFLYLNVGSDVGLLGKASATFTNALVPFGIEA